MTGRRGILMAAAVVLPLLALPAAADHPRLVELTAVTAVETSRSATVDVVLPSEARVTTDLREPGVRFEGEGRLIGVWLERDSGFDHLTSYRLPAFAGGEQVAYGSAPATDCSSSALGSQCAAPDVQEALLPAGRYRLTVLADGAPVRITLQLRGLEAGVTTLQPSRVLASVQKPLPLREGVADSLVTFGDVADLGRPVQTFVVARARSADGSLIEEASACRRDDDGSGQPLAYGPHCPGGTEGGYQYTVADQLIGAGAFASSSSVEHDGPVGLGGSFGDTDGVEVEETLGVWLARP